MLIYDLSNMLQSTVIVQLMSQDDVKAEIAHVVVQNIHLYAKEFLNAFCWSTKWAAEIDKNFELKLFWTGAIFRETA